MSIAQFTEAQLSQSIAYDSGNIPLVITVPHDGDEDALAGVALDEHEDKKRDFNCAHVATEVYSQLPPGCKPYILIQTIRRKRRTPQIIKYFEKRTLDLIRDLSVQHNILFHFDLHGFANQPHVPGAPFDIILGTDHRASVKRSIIDKQFAKYFTRLGYAVYLPMNEIITGEKFVASDPSQSLSPKVAQETAQNVISMQVELAPWLRFQEEHERKKPIERDFATFISSLFSTALS
jgi:N-formylglutamate amidohydrolase